MFNSIDIQGIESAITARDQMKNDRAQRILGEEPDSRETLSLRASEIDFLKNIDKEGIQ